MPLHAMSPSCRALRALSAAMGAVVLLAGAAPRVAQHEGAFDPLLDPASRCGPARAGSSGPPVLIETLLAAADSQRKTETAPFQPAPMQAAEGAPPLYGDLGTLRFAVRTTSPRAQAYVDQGLRLAFAFNHAEAQRAFREAQRLDPRCAMCYWGEALVLGPNINAPMAPEAAAPAWAALQRAQSLVREDRAASAKERALIDALARRYAEAPPADRAALDAAYADAMQAVARRFPRDDTVQALYAESAMDTQPWDYWEAGGARTKGRGGQIVAALETVLARNPTHPGAIHLYIHAVEASTRPERALAAARRLGALMPGAGHIVHMPAHIYYRVGLYRESLAVNKQAVAVDERYFARSPSDPLYRSAYYPHNIHFVMVSAQMGGDGPTALEAGRKLDAALPLEVVKQFAVLEPLKGAPYTTHAQFAAPADTLALPAPDAGLLLVTAQYRYARALAQAALGQFDAAQAEIDAIARIETGSDWKPFEAWGVPAQAVVQTARLVAVAKLADARGDLDGAAAAYEQAVAVENALPYMEPPFWTYPVQQSLGALRLRQGRLDAAETALRASLARVRNNGWSLAALAEVYRRKGDRAAEAATRRAYERAWFGPKAGPELAAL